MAAPAAVLSILVNANTRGAQGGLIRLNQRLTATGSTAQKVTSQVAMVGKLGAIGAAAGLGFAVKKAADFEQQLDSLGSVSGATAREMKMFSKQALKAGAETKFSALDAAVAQTELAKGGLSVQNIMKGGLRSALALAAAGEMELGEAASTTANAMNLFALRGKASMKVADALATAANATTADVDDFAMALRQGGSVAKTAGLSFNETVLALEALAKVGIKNSDAGTSMKTAFLQLIAPTNKQKKLADKLNMSFVDGAGNMKSMAEISKMLRDRLGDMGNAQRTANLKVLAGTDGVRTLTALYASGPEKLDKWKAGLERSGTAAEVAKRKQSNLKGVLENLKGSVETIAIAIGMKFLPALTDAARAVNKLLNDPNLSAQEKLDKFAQMFAHALADVAPDVLKAGAALGVAAVRGFFTAFRESPVWVKMLTAGFLFAKFGGFKGFKTAGAAAGAKMGTAVAESAVATAATGMSTAGASTAWTGWGQKAGTKVGEGVATGATAATTPGRFRKMGGALGTIGKRFLGVSLALGIADAVTAKNMNLSDRIKQALSDTSLGVIAPPKGTAERFGALTKQFASGKLIGPKDMIDTSGFDKQQMHLVHGMRDLRMTADRMFGPGEHLVSGAWANPKHAQKQLTSLTDSFKRMRDGSIVKVSELRRATVQNAIAIEQTLGVHSKRGAAAMQTAFGLGLKTIMHFKRDGTLNVKQAGVEIARLMKSHSKEGREGMEKNLLKSEKAIGKSMTRHGKITDEGTALIRLLMINAMKGMGLSADTIRMSINKRESAKHGFTQPGQVGMVVRGGKPTGDSVHALLERGEVVVNRKAVQKLGGPQKVNQLNQMIPRFQRGGIAGMMAAANKLEHAHFPYVWGGGHQGSPAPFGPMDCSGAVSYVLQHGGVKIPTMVSGALAGAGSPGPGKVTVFANQGHTFMRIGSRYFGTSGSNPGGGAGWMPDPGASYRSGFTQRHFRAGGNFKVPRVTVSGARTGLKTLVQGALDNTRTGANRKLSQLMASSFGGGDIGDPGPGGNAANRRLGQELAARRGWGKGGQWHALDDLWGRLEGSWDENLFNKAGSGAYGIAQALPASKYPAAGEPSAPPGPAKAAAQIGWGLNYIRGRYGDPLGAHAARLSQGWYQKGGIVGLQQGGLPTLLNRAVNISGGLNKHGKRFPAKKRSKSLHRFLDRIKKIGLPKELMKTIDGLNRDSTMYADLADTAGNLNVDSPTGGSTILGRASGAGFTDLTESEWVTKQLETLFKLRNKLIKAKEIITARRARIIKLIKQAHRRLKRIAKQIRAAAKIRRGLVKQLSNARKHPSRNAALIKGLKGKIKGIDTGQGVRKREQRTLNNRILPPLVLRSGTLKGALDENVNPAIDQVQGIGAPMKHYASLPPIGTLRGDIFQAQLRLRDLGVKPVISDSDTESASVLRQLLDEANQRTAVSQAQYDVFKNAPQFGGGGVVAGIRGSAVPAVVHAGEGVFTREQMAAMGAGAGVQVIVNGDIVNTPRGKRPIEIRDIRGGSRSALPGRGGGITRLG